MFIKHNVKTDKNTGVQYRYLRLCESYRIGNKTRHRTIINLGIVDQLDSREKQKDFADRVEQLLTGRTLIFPTPLSKDIEALAQKFYIKIKEKKTIEHTLSAQIQKPQPKVKDLDTVDLNSIETEQVKELGSEWLCYQAIEQLNIRAFLLQQGWSKESINLALIHLISKAVFPVSEHKTAQWIQENSSVAELFSMESLKINRHHLYQASRMLYGLKDKLEPFLSSKTNELFDIQDKIVLYDLTNTYFEGRKVDSEMAQFGRSKEKRSDAKIIALALVTNAEGFIKYSKIYKGNIADCKTLEATVIELSKATSQLDRKPLVVIDAGIGTNDNLEMLKEKGYRYLCVTRSKLKEYNLLADQQVLKLYDKRDNLIEVQRIEKQGSQDAFLYVRSEQKAKKEASMANHYSQLFEEELDNLSKGLSKKGMTKKLEKVWERIGRIKQRYPTANKFYAIDVQSKQGIATHIQWSRKNRKHKNTQGVYFLRCSQADLDEKSLWDIYNTLTEIEATFRTLKTDLSLRPVFHKKDINSEAHIFLGVLAYCIVATIRYQLKKKNIRYDWANIVRKMNTQKNVTTTLINEKGKKIMIKTCSNPNVEVMEIYDALNYKRSPFSRIKFVLPENKK